jgi:hypothetical protein
MSILNIYRVLQEKAELSILYKTIHTNSIACILASPHFLRKSKSMANTCALSTNLLFTHSSLKCSVPHSNVLNALISKVRCSVYPFLKCSVCPFPSAQCTHLQSPVLSVPISKCSMHSSPKCGAQYLSFQVLNALISKVRCHKYAHFQVPSALIPKVRCSVCLFPSSQRTHL